MQPESEVPTWTFGDRLRKARESAGVDTVRMAEHMHTTTGVISQWERGKRRPREDQVTFARKWSEITGVPVEWLLGLDVRSWCFGQSLSVAALPEERRRTLEVWTPERRQVRFPIAA